jgi:hypothetical protein
VTCRRITLVTLGLRRARYVVVFLPSSLFRLRQHARECVARSPDNPANKFSLAEMSSHARVSR